MMGLVTVVMLVYNGTEHIESAIDSVFAQVGVVFS
jgi:hypothetical protein